MSLQSDKRQSRITTILPLTTNAIPRRLGSHRRLLAIPIRPRANTERDAFPTGIPRAESDGELHAAVPGPAGTNTSNHVDERDWGVPAAYLARVSRCGSSRFPELTFLQYPKHGVRDQSHCSETYQSKQPKGEKASGNIDRSHARAVTRDRQACPPGWRCRLGGPGSSSEKGPAGQHSPPSRSDGTCGFHPGGYRHGLRGPQ